MTTNLLANPDWTKGTSTPFTDPAHGNVVRGNMRVPNGWYFEFVEGLHPRLPEQDANAPWLAPELTFRSANGAVHGQTATEALPLSELDLYLAPDAPVVYHAFKAFGIQMWELGTRDVRPAGDYKFSIELFNDVYFSRNQQKVPPDDPRAMEWRISLGTDTDEAIAWMPSNDGFRKWRTVERTFIHPGGQLDVSLEVRARWGVDTVGAFLRRPSLVALNAPPTPPVPPTPPPGGGVATDKLALLTTLVTALDVRIGLVEAVVNGLKADRDAILTELLRIRNLPAD